MRLSVLRLDLRRLMVHLGRTLVHLYLVLAQTTQHRVCGGLRLLLGLLPPEPREPLALGGLALSLHRMGVHLGVGVHRDSSTPPPGDETVPTVCTAAARGSDAGIDQRE